MDNPAIQPGQVWPVLPPELASEAPGLPRVFLVETGEQPPYADAFDVDPLRPETWRAMVHCTLNDSPPKAGAVVLTPELQGAGPAPALLFDTASLAARGMKLLGRLLLSTAIIVALGCKGCA
jgi:hypothetical protein